MQRIMELNRRAALKTVGAGLIGAAVATGTNAQAAEKQALKFRKEDFYKNGAFDVEAGRDAIIELMNYHNYPVFKGAREKLWVSDYGIGDFLNLGLAANMFMNNEEHRYMSMDLFLLPNQMLPEHYHLKTEKNPAKLEGWVVRHGESWIVGEGPETPGLKAKIPASQKKAGATVFCAQLVKPGGFAQLNRATARHWQLAGPEGAIITETANVHDDSGVRHTNPELVFP